MALMGVNKQMYTDACFAFWSYNTFYLPHGPLSHTLFFFGSIRPENKALIKHLAIRFSIRDLTPHVLEDFEAYLRAYRPNLALGLNDGLWARELAIWLHYQWSLKMSWLSLWEGLIDVTLEDSSDERLVLKRRLIQTMKGFPSDEEQLQALCELVVGLFMDQAYDHVRNAIIDNVNVLGKDGFKNALSQGVGDGLGL